MRTLAAMLVLGAIPMLATPAAARIECDGDYQIVDGREIATPYCSDHTLAQVAREHGDRISGREIRRNPGVKSDICRFLGSSPSVSETCADSAD